MKKIALLSVLMFTLMFISLGQTQKISLNSTNPDVVWHIQPKTDHTASGQVISRSGYVMDDAVEGIVPGVVFAAYVEAGLVPDPNFGDNIHHVDEKFFNRPFWYRTTFNLPKDFKKGQKVWLQFDNTNRYADFYFNGLKLSGTAESTKDVSGHMLRTKYEISHLVKPDQENVIAVLITDADQKKTRDAKDQFGVVASPTYLSAASWDWMPYVLGRLAGITGNVSVTITGDITMEDPWVRSELESNDIAYLFVSTDLRNSSNLPQEVVLSGTIQPGNIQFTKRVRVEANSTKKVYIDRKEVEDFLVKQPKLWWPNGYGEPHLYTCSLQTKVDGKLSDSREFQFGIRNYEYQYVRNNMGWPVLQFFINGQRIYVKGGNWGMSEYLLRCQGEEYEKKIKLHKDMNYNMIRLWTGTVTDDEFYDYCDRYGIMVWDDFWLYVAYNDVANDDDFKANALDKVKRLRNHASIALWCGANETHPKPELDTYLRTIVAQEDHNDRMYKSSSNQDGLSGSGWWGNQPPKHHFENSGSNLAWNKPPYPYGSDHGYGLRTEIGTATFPNYESVLEFMPQDALWPLPTDEQLEKDDDNVWNKHYFGKEASNASPINYKRAVNTQFGESKDLSSFTEKAQYLNFEVMKGMYEAWNDKMWEDASGILIWMSQSAFPSFVWQTYDYYHDATGAYWGAKQACEPIHIQWNASNNSVKAINTTSNELKNATATTRVYTLNGKELPSYHRQEKVDVSASNKKEVYRLNFNPNNLAFGKKASASSSQNGRNASFVSDGASGTRWESNATDEEWISLDLEKSQALQAMKIKWEDAYAQEYDVEISKDGRRWTTVKEVRDGKGGTVDISLHNKNARYIRVVGKKRASQFGYSIFEIEVYGKQRSVEELTALHFIKLELKDSLNNILSENFYWRNGEKDLDYTALNDLPKADLTVSLINKKENELKILIKNQSNHPAFGNRLRLVKKGTQERILPVFFSDNYFSLMPGEEKIISIEDLGMGEYDMLWKQYGQQEQCILSELTI